VFVHFYNILCFLRQPRRLLAAAAVEACDGERENAVFRLTMMVILL